MLALFCPWPGGIYSLARRDPNSTEGGRAFGAGLAPRASPASWPRVRSGAGAGSKLLCRGRMQRSVACCSSLVVPIFPSITAQKRGPKGGWVSRELCLASRCSDAHLAVPAVCRGSSACSGARTAAEERGAAGGTGALPRSELEEGSCRHSGIYPLCRWVAERKAEWGLCQGCSPRGALAGFTAGCWQRMELAHCGGSST